MVRLGVVNAHGGKTSWIVLPIQRSEPDPSGKRPREAKDFYITRFGWLKNGIAWAQVLDRLQDQLDLYFIDVSSGHSQLMLSEKSRNWVPVNDDFNVLVAERSGIEGLTHHRLLRRSRHPCLVLLPRILPRLRLGGLRDC